MASAGEGARDREDQGQQRQHPAGEQEHLAEAGVSVVVLEAGEPGWGASGRNGGQVIPGLKHDPDELGAMFGATEASGGAGFVMAARSTSFVVLPS